MTVNVKLTEDQILEIVDQLNPDQRQQLASRLLEGQKPDLETIQKILNSVDSDELIKRMSQLSASNRKEIRKEFISPNLENSEVLLDVICQLLKEEREKLTYQLRKEEGVDEFLQKMDEITSETDPKDLPSEEEIVNLVSEVREEKYQKRKKNS